MTDQTFAALLFLTGFVLGGIILLHAIQSYLVRAGMFVIVLAVWSRLSLIALREFHWSLWNILLYWTVILLLWITLTVRGIRHRHILSRYHNG